MTGAPLGSLELRRVDDYEAIRRLGLASGLEDGTFQRTVAAFGYYLIDELLGCATLRRDGDGYSVDWLAVAEDKRGRGLGERLVGAIADEAKSRGATRLWALARAPEFFEKIGFRPSVSEDGIGPAFDNCLLCHQYMKSCHPAVMIKEL